MNSPKPTQADQTGLLREAYAALNRGDIPAFMSIFDPQILRIEPAEPPEAGTFRGLEAVREHVAKARATWAEGGCEPQQFIASGDRIMVLVHVRVRLKHEAQWREGDTADVYTFRGGKAIEFRTFFSESQAREWVGLMPLVDT